MMQLSGSSYVVEGGLKASMNDNYIDQVRQSKQVSEVEGTKLLEPGEVVVLCFDKIKEIKRTLEGKIYITNYRVSYVCLHMCYVVLVH